MRVLFVNRSYWPDDASTAQQLQDLAEHLAARGHDVDVLCAGAGAERLPRLEERAGVRIHRLWSPRRRLARGLDHPVFHAQATTWMLRHARHDVVVTLADPPLLGAASALVRALGRRRLRRVAWPTHLPADGPLAALDAWCLRSADLVVALGECMRRRLLARRVPAERIRVIPPSSPELPRERRAVESLRREFGLQDAFVVLHAEDAGTGGDFRSTCEAMRRLRHDAGIQFVFAGGGARSGEVAACASAAGARYRRLPRFSRDRMAASLAVGDVHLVTLRDDVAGLLVPRIASSFAAGRPVVFVGPVGSSVAQHVSEAGAGHVLRTDDPGGLVAAIRRLANLPAQRHAMGARARAYFRERLEKDRCFTLWEDALRAAAAA